MPGARFARGTRRGQACWSRARPVRAAAGRARGPEPAVATGRLGRCRGPRRQGPAVAGDRAPPPPVSLAAGAAPTPGAGPARLGRAGRRRPRGPAGRGRAAAATALPPAADRLAGRGWASRPLGPGPRGPASPPRSARRTAAAGRAWRRCRRRAGAPLLTVVRPGRRLGDEPVGPSRASKIGRRSPVGAGSGALEPVRPAGPAGGSSPRPETTAPTASAGTICGTPGQAKRAWGSRARAVTPPYQEWRSCTLMPWRWASRPTT